MKVGMLVVSTAKIRRSIQKQLCENYSQISFAAVNACIGQADFIVSVLPFTNKTLHFFGREQFQAMKNKGVFINIGRGKTVDQSDLRKSLQTGEMAHAVLDVFDEEPLHADDPLWDMAQVTITPHVSGVTPKYQHRAFEIFEDNFQIFLDGGHDFKNQIDYDRGY